jgi:arylsulfatase A-like enzyme
MADEGMRFTDFYVTSGVCTPSRSSLMTGCYPRRVGLHVDSKNFWVLFPGAKKGLHPDEITVAEVLKKEGYATACIGKWHLGDQKEFLPTRQGFDYYYGIPYSNDMGGRRIPLPLMKNEEVIQAPADQPTLTQDYTKQALAFIENNKEKPFFLYLPHTMVHLPLQASAKFKNKSANGRYGDAVEEVDWSTGEILKKLKDLGIDNNTMVIFSSDNGSNGRNGGSNDPLRGFKGNTDEGSMRVPCIVRYPGSVPANTICRELASTIDILPTFAKLSGAAVPGDRIVDGKNIWPLMSGRKGAKSPHQAFYYYHTTQLQAVRSGKWKLILPLTQKKRGWSGQEHAPLRLVNLETDIHEDNDLSMQFPEIVKKLMAFADKARRDLGDMKSRGTGQRDAGWVENPTPRLLKKP